MTKPSKKPKKQSKYHEKFIPPKGMTTDELLKLAATTPKKEKNDNRK